MRHALLTLIVAFAMAASGLASANASGCPMMAAAALAHDCCPDENGSDKNQPQQQQHDMDGCTMGMACRTAPAIAPSIAPVSLPNATSLLSSPPLREAAELSGPLQQLFRPPRTT